MTLEHWHRRYGHADKNMILQLANQELVNGIKLDNKTMTTCDTCRLNKMSIEPISKIPRERATTKLELVHSDISGPHGSSLHGNRYAISFIDDKTKYAKVYYMKQKSEAVDKLKEYIAFCNPSKIQKLRSDNGTEYQSSLFKKYVPTTALHKSFLFPIVLIKTE